MADKKVTVEVQTDSDLTDVEALEKRVNALKRQRIQLQIDADTSSLNTVSAKLKEAENQLGKLEAARSGLINMRVDDSQIEEAQAEVEALKQEKIALEIAVETGKLHAAKEEIENMNGEVVTIDVQTSMQNISQGASQAKQGVNELAGAIGEVQQAGIQSEQSKAFLEMNLGADKAKQTYQQISDIVAKMPGDDNTMRSVLSTAQALGNNLNASEMEAAAGTMADYMSGSATMGKQALESQQDIMKYLLDGNTAELERGSIVSSQVDKLKDANTFQERQAAMQEVLNDLGYGGIANMDTTLKKQMEWEGMMYNSQDALSSMWLGAETGAMDYILKLDDATGGIVGMGLAAGSMAAGPLVDIMGGIGQIRLGFQGLKDAADFAGIGSKLGSLKTTLMGVGSKAKEAALSMLDLGKKTLIAGYNALKSAAMWVVEKGAKAASTLASWAMTAAQAALNFVMSLNPIVLVVLALVALAAALIWAYYNVDWFREMVDNAWQSIVQLAQAIWSYISPAIDWISGLFQQFTQQLGLNTNDWLQALLGFILFLPTLPIKIGIALVNSIARLLGFKGNFVETMMSTGISAVTNFITQISQLPGKLAGELQKMYSTVSEWASTLPQKFWDAGVDAVKGFLDALGIHSPGFMFYAIQGELNRIDKVTGETDFSGNMANMGQRMANSFNPNLDLYNGSSSMSAGLNLTINIESVDNEERIQQIVRAVETALKFDNETAGRSV